MTKKKTAADYIAPLDINGMSGRMLRMPPPKGKTIDCLFVYGQHSSLERWWGLMQSVNRFAGVTAPDLPGIGGMDSFYKIGKKPTIDNFADYLAAFVKLRYKNKQVVIIGMSLGFVIATRMLQRYPELKANVKMLVSLVGITHGDDFKFDRKLYYFFRTVAFVMSWWPAAVFFKFALLNAWVLRTFYHRTVNAKHKFAAAKDRAEHDYFMDVEIWLWQHNDVRTHAVTTTEMFTLDNCQTRVGLPLWHVTTDVDQYLDEHRVEQHLRIIFGDVHVIRSPLGNHAPSIIADEKAAAPLIPPQLRQAIAKL